MNTPKRKGVFYCFDLSGFEISLYRKEFSENTVSCYIRDIKEFLKWLELYGKHVLRLTSFVLQRYKKHLLKVNQSILSINRKLASLNSFCKFLHNDNLLVDSISVKLIKNRTKANTKVFNLTTYQL